MSWRDRARPIIAQVLHDTKGKTEAEIDKAIFDAYPFGTREHWPYKVWLTEVRWQRVGIWKKSTRTRETPKWKIKEDQQRLEEWEAIYGKRERT